MLSTTKGEHSRLIAIVRGGKQDGLKIYLDDTKRKGEKKGDKGEKKLSRKELDLLEDLDDLYQEGELDEYQEEKFLELKKRLKSNDSGKIIKIDDGELYLVPVKGKHKRDSLYYCGPSGSGKSYTAARYVKLYRKLFPEHPIYLFSILESDPAFDGITGLQRIMINEELIDNPINIQELKDCLVIFDDVDTLQDKLKKNIQHLQRQILECSRKLNTYIISTSHLMNDGARTRSLLNEADYIILFPQSGSIGSLKRALKYYLGFNNKQIDKLLNTDSRWVIIHKSSPMFVMEEKQIYLIKNFDDIKK